MAKLKRLTVRGYKSIRALENFELRSLNVLIGANGAGKTNFISLFRMLAALYEQQLQLYVQEHDGPDGLLFGTRKQTQQLEAEFYFGANGYFISLKPSGQRLIFTREATWFAGNYGAFTNPLGSGHDEALLSSAKGTFENYVKPAIESWRIYHFHDTSDSAPIRHAQPVRDNLRLKTDGANLAPFLRMLYKKHADYYDRILKTIQLAAPFLDDFVYREEAEARVELEWFQVGDPDTPYSPRLLSDGTLRFIALTTLLLQPPHLQPDTLLIDEPELGLHPYALSLLAGLLKQVAETKQLIVSTQSVELVNGLNPDDVIVVNRRGGESTFERLNAEALQEWLSEYALGELWKMNVLGGRPTR